MRSYKNHGRSKKSKRNSLVNQTSPEEKVLLVSGHRNIYVSPNQPSAPPSLLEIDIIKMANVPSVENSPTMMRGSLPQRRTTGDCPCPKCRDLRISPDLSEDEEHDSTGQSSGTVDHGVPRWEPMARSYFQQPHRYFLSPESSFSSDSTGPTGQNHRELDPAFTSNYPQLYVWPRAAVHISFPVVDYSDNHWPADTPWPHFYMALAPESAVVEDLKTALAPKGSGTILTARSRVDGEEMSVDSFFDITKLRCSIMQLEIVVREGEGRPKATEKRSEYRRDMERPKPIIPFDIRGRIPASTPGTIRINSYKHGKKGRKTTH
jgi:hypothetical protein